MAIIVEIDSEIFQLCPSFHRGLIVAWEVDNRGLDPALDNDLRRAGRRARGGQEPGIEDPALTWPLEAPLLRARARGLFEQARRHSHRPFRNKVEAIATIASLEGGVPVATCDLARAGELFSLRSQWWRRSPGLGGWGAEAVAAGAHAGNGVGDHVRWLAMAVDAVGEGAEARVLAGLDRISGLLYSCCHAQVRSAVMGPGHGRAVIHACRPQDQADPGVAMLEISAGDRAAALAAPVRAPEVA